MYPFIILSSDILLQFSPNIGICHFACILDLYDSETTFQVLTNPHHIKLSWLSGFPDKEIPIDKAVKADKDEEKANFYIGRIQTGSSLLVGKVYPQTKNLFYATEDKKGHEGKNYALLVVDNDQN